LELLRLSDADELENNIYSRDSIENLSTEKSALESSAFEYMILPRDKPRTYAIITRVPQMANFIRNSLKRPNVRIENKDTQLLEELLKYSTSNIGPSLPLLDHDIIFYQMCYQVWRARPNEKKPRSIAVTKSTVLLCAEDLHRIDIRLIVVDSYKLKNIHKVYIEEGSPLHVTLVFKSSNLFSVKKKWRLLTDSVSSSNRILENCHRVVSEIT
jgi:hypothetical protein